MRKENFRNKKKWYYLSLFGISMIILEGCFMHSGDILLSRQRLKTSTQKKEIYIVVLGLPNKMTNIISHIICAFAKNSTTTKTFDE